MDDAAEESFLQGRRVCVLVWNAFVHDARVRRESESLAARGARVRIVCIQAPARKVARELDGDLEIVRVRAETWLSRALGGRIGTVVQELTGSIAMLFQLLAYRPALVHGNDVNTLAPAWLGARLSGARLIYDAHEISADREGYRGRVWLVKTLESMFGTRADARMTTTRMRADWFEGNYGFEDMHVVQNRPDFSAVESDRIREKLPIPNGHLVVLYQGGLQPGRGLSNLIRAVKQVGNVHLVFVGDGGQRAELEALAEDCHERIHFVGQVPLAELPLWTASADVGVQALRNTCLNHYTTDSNKLFEYVMGGLPVIASDFPEIRAIVETYDLGLLIDPDDVESLKAAIVRYAEDPAFLAACKANALAARKLLDWTSQEPEFFAAYRQAMVGGGSDAG